ncbi:MAG: hypothetical protein SFU98_14380 [Leptospiraceae bacterium]|nr:hypothetical protein [Leptospiraceae bacterium]
MNHFFLLLVIALSFCNQENKFPEPIPKDASFEKRTGLYSFIKDKKFFQYSESGKKYSECEVNDKGEKEGLCKTFSIQTQALLSEGKMRMNPKDGQSYKDGVWVWRFPNGNIYYKQEFAFDKKKSFWIDTNLLGNEHGEYERFYEDGKLEEKGNFDSGKRTGAWKKYYRNTKLEFVGSYRNDKKIGNWIFYYPNGNEEMKEQYDETSKLTSRITYNLDGSKNQTYISGNN